MWNLERQGEREIKTVQSDRLCVSPSPSPADCRVISGKSICSFERDTAVISAAQTLLNQPGATWNTQAAPVKKVQK